MKSINLVFLLLTICYTNLFHAQLNSSIIQRMTNPTGSYQSIVNDADSLFKIERQLNNGTVSSEEKAFRRWQYYNAPRSSYPGVQKGGSIGGVEEYLQGHGVFNNCTANVNTIPWTFIGQNPTLLDNQSIGIVVSIAVHPTNQNIIYLGSNTAGLWKSTDGGVNWINKTDVLGIASFGVNAIAIDPLNPNNLLIGTGTRSYGYSGNPQGVGVLKSSDGGNTWTNSDITPIPGSFLNIEMIKYNHINSNIVYAIGNKKIRKSINGGLNWDSPTDIDANTTFEFIDFEINIANPTILYASTLSVTGGKFWTSLDAGATWTNKTPPNIILSATQVADRIIIDVTPSEPNDVYVIYHNQLNQNIRKSTNNGNNWTIINESPVSAYGY